MSLIAAIRQQQAAPVVPPPAQLNYSLIEVGPNLYDQGDPVAFDVFVSNFGASAHQVDLELRLVHVGDGTPVEALFTNFQNGLTGHPMTGSAGPNVSTLSMSSTGALPGGGDMDGQMQFNIDPNALASVPDSVNVQLWASVDGGPFTGPQQQQTIGLQGGPV